MVRKCVKFIFFIGIQVRRVLVENESIVLSQLLSGICRQKVLTLSARADVYIRQYTIRDDVYVPGSVPYPRD